MSRSPRKLLSRAVDALRDMDDVLARYPEAEADVRAALGDEGLADMRRAREVLSRAAARLTPEQPGMTPKSAREGDGGECTADTRA